VQERALPGLSWSLPWATVYCRQAVGERCERQRLLLPPCVCVCVCVAVSNSTTPATLHAGVPPPFMPCHAMPCTSPALRCAVLASVIDVESTGGLSTQARVPRCIATAIAWTSAVNTHSQHVLPLAPRQRLHTRTRPSINNLPGQRAQDINNTFAPPQTPHLSPPARDLPCISTASPRLPCQSHRLRLPGTLRARHQSLMGIENRSGSAVECAELLHDILPCTCSGRQRLALGEWVGSEIT